MVKPGFENIIQLRPSQRYTLKLASNPSTGYDWEVQKGYDMQVIQIVSSKYYSKASPKMVGAGGVRSWQIKALQKGQAKLTLVYKRSWEKEIAEKKIICFQVK